MKTYNRRIETCVVGTKLATGDTVTGVSIVEEGMSFKSTWVELKLQDTGRTVSGPPGTLIPVPLPDSDVPEDLLDACACAIIVTFAHTDSPYAPTVSWDAMDGSTQASYCRLARDLLLGKERMLREQGDVKELRALEAAEAVVLSVARARGWEWR